MVFGGIQWGGVSRTVKTDDCLATMIEINNDTNPKIVGYSRSRECSGKVVDFHLNENANCIHGSTGSRGNTDQYVFEPQNQPSINLFGQYNSSQNSRVVRTDGISYCVSNGHKDGTPKIATDGELAADMGCLVDKDGKCYRIRKLTPRECFRLMDVKDEDIDKIQQAGIAKTNLYKLAGNSIVVSCMYHIFRKMLIDKENENQQLELF